MTREWQEGVNEVMKEANINPITGGYRIGWAQVRARGVRRGSSTSRLRSVQQDGLQDRTLHRALTSVLPSARLRFHGRRAHTASPPTGVSSENYAGQGMVQSN